MQLAPRALLFIIAFASLVWADTQSQTVTLPPATVGNGYAVRLAFKGFVVATPYSVAASKLPDGAAFDANTGLLTGNFGKDRAGQDLDVVLTLTDANQNIININGKLHVNAGGPAQLTRSGAKLPPATVGQPYDVELSPAEVPFNAPYTISATNPPQGLAMEGNHIKGTPTSANPAEGDYTIPIRIADSTGANAIVWPVTLRLYLNPQVVTISPPSCTPPSPPAVIGVPQDQASTIAGQTIVPKGCTAKIRIWNVDHWRPTPTAPLNKTTLSNFPGISLLAITSGGDVSTTGAFTVTLSNPLIAGQTLYIEEYLFDASGNEVTSSFSAPVYVEGFGDWGRVRSYFTAGILISQDQGSFSQSSLFLSFVLDKTWRLPGYYYGKSDGTPHLRWPPGFNTFFETRLTSVPVTACPTGNQAQTPSNQCTATNQSFNTFLTSQKTALLQVGGYFPFTMTAWKYRGNANTLFLAPLAKVGFNTPTSPINQNQAQGQSAGAGNPPAPGTGVTPVNTNNFYNFYGYGFRTGHYSMTNTKDHAPELISHLDFIVGRFSNLETFLAGPSGVPQRARLYRIALEGILKVPTIPLVIGFSANVGQEAVGVGNNTITQRAGDDLRFLFGTKFDVGKLMARLRTTFQ